LKMENRLMSQQLQKVV